MHHAHRHTVWQTPDGRVAQVACARLDAQTLEPLAEATEHVGERDDPSGCLVVACGVAGDLAAGQYPGQLRLAIGG